MTGRVEGGTFCEEALIIGVGFLIDVVSLEGLGVFRIIGVWEDEDASTFVKVTR